jgi:hypothetical protein
LKQFSSLEQVYEDLKDRVGEELRKIAGSDPPKKKAPVDLRNAKKTKKKKKRKLFDPPVGYKVKLTGTLTYYLMKSDHLN